MDNEIKISITCPNCKAPITITPEHGKDEHSFQCTRCGKYSTVNNLVSLMSQLSKRGA